jgi:hypothetical protein
LRGTLLRRPTISTKVWLRGGRLLRPTTTSFPRRRESQFLVAPARPALALRACAPRLAVLAARLRLAARTLTTFVRLAFGSWCARRGRRRLVTLFRH